MTKKTIALLISLLALIASAACQGSPTPINITQSAAATSSVESSAVTAAGDAATPVVTASPTSIAEIAAENSQTHATATTSVQAADAETTVVLNGDAIATDGPGVTVEGNTATITAAGTYRITGALTDGQIVVETQDKGNVELILDGAAIHNADGAAINVADADVAVIILAAGTDNVVSDGAAYVFADPATDEPNAAIFSSADLTLTGGGALTVTGQYNDGIASKDGLVIAGGEITVDAADDGIRGKDYLVIEDGALIVTAGGDGLKSDNEEDATKGYIAIDAGSISVTAAGDAIAAQTDVTIAGGEFTLAAGGGSTARLDESISAKGVKAGVNVVIEGGTFAIDTADDALHANSTLTVNGGTFAIATGDDGMHADAELIVNAGDITITRSYEGIESAVITLNGGNIDLVSSDDGLNVAGGNDGSGMAAGGRPARGGPRQDAFAAATNQYLRIHGGRIAVNAGGDGIDINGSVEMTDGVLIVHGPTENMNAAVDYDGSFTMTGGYLIAAGSSGMAQAPDTSSSQLSLLVNLSAQVEAGTLLHLEASDGTEIFTFAPAKAFQSITFSSAELVDGATYVLWANGSAAGAAQNGLYEAGSYTAGEEVGSFALSGIVTVLGGRGR